MAEAGGAWRLEAAAGFYRGRGEIARYARAELRFLRWEIDRGVLDERSGSPWWRAVNDRLLRDRAEAALVREDGGEPPSAGARAWAAFLAGPSPERWYRAHNSSVVAGYLENEDLAAAELPAERLMINVTLSRVLYAHAMVAVPRLALGPLAALGPRLGDPRTGSVGMFLDLRNVFPQHYPLDGWSTGQVMDLEGRRARMLDHGVIKPRLRELYAFSARALDEPRLVGLLNGDIPSYARPDIDRSRWHRRRLLHGLATLVTAPGR
ncbi:hypothetical protein [Actinomadura kijaniata]|uniref:hypothetical protein n=1 Tax=Actinomadura kijaniata TaxID=46161 RepID=UPI00082FAE72|nr:hypothetical protein [Actinomadura kijaniata]